MTLSRSADHFCSTSNSQTNLILIFLRDERKHFLLVTDSLFHSKEHNYNCFNFIQFECSDSQDMSIRGGCRKRRINKESVQKTSSSYEDKVRSELASTLVVHFR